jgi:RecA-family ATPase
LNNISPISGERVIAFEPPAPLPPLKIIRPEQFIGAEIPPRQWIVDKWIPCGVVTGLYGDGGMGKSLLAQQLQTACAGGGEWCGQVVTPVKSLGFFCEDDELELLRRQERLNRFYLLDNDTLANMAYVSRVSDENTLISFDGRGRGELTPFYKQAVAASLDFGARLVIFDTAADGFAGNENSRPEVRQFVGYALNAWAQKINGAVLLCAHPSRSGLSSGSGDGGSTAWNNSMRSRLYLSSPEAEDGKPPDENARILSRKKANYAARNETIKLVWNEGVFVVDRPDAELFRPAPDAVFMELLDAMTAEGRPVSHKPKANNYAPRAFAYRPDRRGYRERDFERAMERLFATKRIRAHEEGPPSRRVAWIIKV